MDIYKVVCGVPQGSILRTKLFILYINYLCKVSNIVKFILFADDTNIYSSGFDLKELYVYINKELEKFNEWFALNKLSLNVSKTNFMRFGNIHSNVKIELRIGDKEIEEVFVTKFLGVLMDNKLNWKEHICMIKSKLAKSNAIIYRASEYLDTFSLKILYCSLFMPYISYCSEIRGKTYITYIKSLYLLQKKVVRTMSKVGRLYHTNALFIDLKLIKLCDLIDLKIAIIVFKVKQKVLLPNIHELF